MIESYLISVPVGVVRQGISTPFILLYFLFTDAGISRNRITILKVYLLCTGVAFSPLQWCRYRSEYRPAPAFRPPDSYPNAANAAKVWEVQYDVPDQLFEVQKPRRALRPM